MKTKRMMWLSVLVVGLMAPIVHAWSYNPDVFTVASQSVSSMDTRMAGNFIIWKNMIEMRWYGFDLAARESFTIGGSGAAVLVSNEAYAVWQDSMTMIWHAYDLTDRRAFTLPIADVEFMSARLTGRFLIFRGMSDMILRGMDLRSGEVFDIAAGSIDVTSICARGDYVIWRTMAMPPTLAGYQLSMRQGFVLREADMDSRVAMSEQFVAWREWTTPDPTGRLWGYDLKGRERFLISTEDMDSMSLRAAGRFIVARHMMTGVLYGFDGVSREIFEIGENVDSTNLAINEHYAIWKDTMDMRLYGFNFASRQQIETDVESSTYIPTLSGSYMLYFLYDPDLMTTELRGFDLATGEGFTVALLSSAAPVAPIADGDYVAWTDSAPPSAETQLLGARIWKVPNDACEEAILVTAQTAYVGDTSGATGADQSDCGFGDWRDTWHEFRPLVGGEYTIDLRSDAFDTTLAVFVACTSSAMGCNDDANIQTTDSRLVMTLVNGKRYLMRVAGVDGAAGPYELTISMGSCAAPPRADLTDDCVVNLEDLAVFSSQWLDCGLDPADLCP